MSLSLKALISIFFTLGTVLVLDYYLCEVRYISRRSLRDKILFLLLPVFERRGVPYLFRDAWNKLIFY